MKKQSILSRYNNLPINRKLTIALVTISIIPVLLLQMISFVITNHFTKDKINDFVRIHLEQAYHAVGAMIDNYELIISEIENNSSMMGHINNMNNWSHDYQLSVFNLRERFQEIVFSDRSILGVSIITSDGAYASYDSVSLSVKDNYLMNVSDIKRQGMYDEILAGDRFIIGSGKYFTDDDYGDIGVIYAGKKITDSRSTKRGNAAVIIFALNEAVIEETYSQFSGDGWNITFLMNSYGEIISYPDKSYLGTNISQADNGITEDIYNHKEIESFIRSTETSMRGNVITQSVSEENSNFAVLEVLDEGYIFGGLWASLFFLIFLGIAAALFALFVIRKTSKDIKGKVSKIISNMRHANQKNLDVYVDIKGEDEFAEIGSGFNNMITEMKALIMRENDALNKQRHAEIAALEAQINPHFIYNTLDAINWMAIEHREHEISEMLKTLALIMRYSVHNSNEIISIEDELSYIRKYIFLQKKRYNDAFECFVSVSEDAKNIRIHKLLIQPLVENSLIHAFPGNSGHDRIDVRIHMENDMLIIEVSDNGKGMPEELINKINSYDHRTDSVKTSIGIYNVISRIKMYYGDESVFLIEKNEPEGTKIVITIDVNGGKGSL